MCGEGVEWQLKVEGGETTGVGPAPSLQLKGK